MSRTLAGFLLCLVSATCLAQMAPPWTPPSATSAPGTPAAPAAPQVPPQSSPPIFPAAASPAPPASPAQAQPASNAQANTSLPPGAQAFDYSLNLKSSVFGANMFTGAFMLNAGAALFNPDHVVALGDQLQVRLWGAYAFDAVLTTDPQGNIFLPQVGPVRVAGVTNRDLPKVLEEAVRRTFKSNVYSYISLAAAQPVRVFVTGFVYRPGMYQGTSSDSVLRYLDQAGGIDPDRGSFLDVRVMRGAQERARFNLYDFLLSGQLPAVQLGDGDVVVVAPRQSTFLVVGQAENPKRFEFAGDNVNLPHMVALAKPFPTATHVRITRNTGTVLNTDYYPLGEVSSVKLQNGDQVEFTADKRPGTISVRVQGEHVSPQEYVLPYGSQVGDVLKSIQYTERADRQNLQLFRQSVKQKQTARLQAAIQNMEQAVLTARSGTNEESSLRKQEADLWLNWTQRARSIQPLGQVVLAQAPQRDQLLLEDGDVLQVPVNDGLVQVQGEVMFATAISYDPSYQVEDYIKRVGGYSQNADSSKVLIAHRDGSFTHVRASDGIRPGDDVLVLPKVDEKNRQFLKDVSQIIFQIALAAKVVFGL